MKKQKILTEKEMALNEVLDARIELERAEQVFNLVAKEYFEIANTELTIAQMKYEVAVKKLKKITGEDEGVNPQMNLFIAVSY